FASQGAVALVTAFRNRGPVEQTSDDAPRAGMPLVPAAITLVIVAVFANWPVLSASEMRAITETNLATALQSEGRTAEALQRYRRAIEIAPDYAPAYNNLGVALRAQGDVKNAIQSYERAIAINDSYPDAHYNLANALLADDRPAEAQQHFEI